MYHDKKTHQNAITLILPEGIGKSVIISEPDTTLIKETLQEALAL